MWQNKLLMSKCDEMGTSFAWLPRWQCNRSFLICIYI